MRIGFLNYFDDAYSRIGALSVPNKVAYCERHGYDYLLSHEPISPERPASWNKVRLFQKHIKDYDYLFWNDTDTFVMNQELPLEALVDPVYPILVGSDGQINCGNILVQNMPGIDAILEEWWNEDGHVTHPLWEQHALSQLMRRDPWWLAHVKEVPQAVMNSYPVNYRPGDFLVHFAGFGRQPAVLEAMMRDWLELGPESVLKKYHFNTAA
jgi:hypothetical protein